MNIFQETNFILTQLKKVIHQLSIENYTKKNEILSQSSIGEHVRHIIELFQQLEIGYENGIVDYDKRKRELKIQECNVYASECIDNILKHIEKKDKPLTICSIYGDEEQQINSNYYRELMYNIEHCIHHQAIIKIAFIALGNMPIEPDFGVAKSTILYKKQCAH